MIEILSTFTGIMNGSLQALPNEGGGYASAEETMPVTAEQAGKLIQWAKNGGDGSALTSRVSHLSKMMGPTETYLRETANSIKATSGFNVVPVYNGLWKVRHSDPFLFEGKYVIISDLGSWSVNNDRLIITWREASAGYWNARKNKPRVRAVLNGVAIDRGGVLVDVEKRVLGIDVASNPYIRWAT